MQLMIDSRNGACWASIRYAGCFSVPSLPFLLPLVDQIAASVVLSSCLTISMPVIYAPPSAMRQEKKNKNLNIY